VSVSLERRDELFDSAREALRERGYVLDRVDSAAGVVTTHPKPSGGVPTRTAPLSDTIHQQARTVRVEFSNSDTGSIARVSCSVSRATTPSMRLSPVAIGLSSASEDPRLVARSLGWRFESPVWQDEEEAGALAGAIRDQFTRERPAASR
jgi:hypothetical protein